MSLYRKINLGLSLGETTRLMLIGRVLSHYRVLEKLGEGGMGEVYLAQDNSPGRSVALKFLPASLTADEIAQKRFLREARSAAILDHPYICNVFDPKSGDTHVIRS